MPLPPMASIARENGAHDRRDRWRRARPRRILDGAATAVAATARPVAADGQVAREGVVHHRQRTAVVIDAAPHAGLPTPVVTEPPRATLPVSVLFKRVTEEPGPRLQMPPPSPPPLIGYWTLFALAPPMAWFPVSVLLETVSMPPKTLAMPPPTPSPSNVP